MEEKEIKKIRVLLTERRGSIIDSVKNMLSIDPDQEVPDSVDELLQELKTGGRLSGKIGEKMERQLQGIDDALERMEAGEYGVCTGCGTEISHRRLEVRPATPVCIDCKEEAERKERELKVEQEIGFDRLFSFFGI